MDWLSFHSVLVIIQKSISFLGALIIFFGVIRALIQYVYQLLNTGDETSKGTSKGKSASKGQETANQENAKKQSVNINTIRLKLGKDLLLGLEFIVAADLIGTTTTPDYYSLGLVGGIVLIRTILSFTLNRELMTLKNEA